MEEPVSALAEDLELKFKDLCSMHDQPALYLSDYFYELRNRIDIDAEQLLLELETNDPSRKPQALEEEADRVNGLRNNFIGVLKRIEDDLLEKLKVPLSSTTSGQVYADLGRRIDEFRRSLCNDEGMVELEEAYTLLEQEIFDQTSRLEAKLFWNQTICYLNRGKKLGQLVYVENGHLNKVELEALK